MRADGGEELAGSQLEWDVGLLEGIDGDEIVLGLSGIHEGASIFFVDMQVGFVHAKILAPDIDDGRVNLYPVDGYGTVDLCDLVSNRTGGEANDGDAMQLPGRKSGVEI